MMRISYLVRPELLTCNRIHPLQLVLAALLELVSFFLVFCPRIGAVILVFCPEIGVVILAFYPEIVAAIIIILMEV